MENNFKRFLSLLLALVMVLGMMPVGYAHAAEIVASSTNLALGRPARGTSTESGTTFTADKAVDGDKTTADSRWATNQSIVSAEDAAAGIKPEAQSLMIDLGSEQSVKRIEIYFEREDNAQNIKAYEVKVSSDEAVWTNPEQSESWETVYTYDKAEKAKQHETIVLENAKTARYVMLTVTDYDGGSANWYSVSVREFEVYAPDYVMNIGDTATITVDGTIADVTDENGVVDVDAMFIPETVERVETAPAAEIESGSKYVIVNKRLMRALETSASSNQLLCRETIPNGYAWTITAVEGETNMYYVQTADGKYLTVGSNTSGTADDAQKIEITVGPDAKTWKLKQNGQFLCDFNNNNDGKTVTCAGYGGDPDTGNPFYLYKVSMGQAYEWNIANNGEAVASVEGGKQYIFAQRHDSQMLLANAWNNQGGGGSGVTWLKLKGNKDNISDLNVWNLTATDNADFYYVGDDYGMYLSVGNGKAKMVSAATEIKVSKGSTTFPNHFQIGQVVGNTTWYLNRWGGSYSGSTAVGGWSDVNDTWSSWSAYEVTKTALGTTTVTIEAIAAGETELTIGDTTYTIYVAPATEEHEHKYVGTVTLEPTCTAEGEMTYQCSCGDIERTEPIPMIAHSYGEGVVTTAPTLNAEGVKTFTCSACGNEKTEVIPQLTAKNAKVLNGDTVLALSDCEYTLGGTENAYSLSHGGNYYIRHRAGNTQTPKIHQTTTESALLVLDWAAYNDGGKLLIKQNSDNAVIYIHYNDAEPTWNTNSSKAGENTAMYLLYADENSTNQEIPGYTVATSAEVGKSYLIAAKNQYGNWFVMVPTVSSTDKDHIAKIVDDEVTHTHDYTTITTVDATCTATGLTTKTCDCGHVHKEIIPVNADAHAWGEPVFTWSDTTAVATVTCTNDASHTQNLEVTVTSSSTTGDCQTDIVTTYTAATTFNGVEYTSTNVVNGDKNTAVHTDTVAYRNNGDGTHTSYYKCCDAEIETVEHTYEDYTYNNDATCTANGTETGTCICGATDTREAADTMLEHTYENYTYNNDATFDANGTETGTCVCGATNTREVAGTQKVAVAEANGTKYETLDEAIAVSGEVKLLADVEIFTTIKITNTVTLDLNGQTLTGPDDGAGNWYAFIVDGGNLTLMDSVGGGELYAKCYGVETKSGSFTMESGVITATKNMGIGTAVVNYGGTVTINGGTLSGAINAVSTGGHFAVAETVINGGTLNGPVTVSDYNAKGCTVKSAVNTYAVSEDYKWVEQDDVYVLTAKVYVAQIGETKYESLAEAVEAAEPNDTVTLLDNTNGDGIIINKDITIDLGSFTYTIDGTLVGSTGTKSCGFQILSGNTVTIMNGAIVMDENAVRGHDNQVGNNFVIQNYADLTLEDVAITGNSNTSYVVSINSGNVAMTGDTAITAPEGAVAFDVCKYASYAEPNVTVNTTGTITGEIEVTGGELNIEAATIVGVLDYTAGKVTKAADVTLAAPEGYEWENNTTLVKSKLAIYKTSMTMANSLDMNFSFAKNSIADWTGHYAVIVKNYADGSKVEQTVEFENWKTAKIDDIDCYYVTFNGIAAKEMTDDLFVTIYNAAGEAVSETYTDSVQKQAMRNLDNNVSALNNTMVVDMLNYGAEAQNKAGYNLTNLANSKLSDAQKAFATETVEFKNEMTFEGEGKYVANVKMMSNIQFMMGFSGIDQTMKAVITFNDWTGKAHEITINGTEFVKNGGYYTFTIEETVIADGRLPITCEIFDSNGNSVAKVVDSIASYADRTTQTPELYEAIMKFSDSALAYLTTK